MSESSLSIGFPELQIEVGYLLGYGRTPANWSVAQEALIDSIVQSGVRRVYFPPAVSDGKRIVEAGYEWSWLRPTTTLVIESGTADYDLPDDFSRLVGNFHYAEAEYKNPITQFSVGDILASRARTSTTGIPYKCAVRFKECDGTTGSRQEVLFYPEPDGDYTLSYEYEAYTGALSDDAPYPLGGMKMGELFIESCLAVAEARMDQEAGIHTATFQTLLIDAIMRDKKQGAVHYGQMGSRGNEAREFHRGYDGTVHECYYNGELLE
jgi:hypothetical protein